MKKVFNDKWLNLFLEIMSVALVLSFAISESVFADINLVAMTAAMAAFLVRLVYMLANRKRNTADSESKFSGKSLIIILSALLAYSVTLLTVSPTRGVARLIVCGTLCAAILIGIIRTLIKLHKRQAIS